MDHGRARRIATGAMLLAVGATRLLPPATSYFLVAFGGALFGAAMGAPAGALTGRRVLSDAPAPLSISPQALEIKPMKPPGAYGALLATGLALGAGGLILYPLLSRSSPPRLQASSGGARPASTVGRAVAPTADPQLHVVAVGQRFVLARAQVTIAAASLCRAGSNVRVAVPAQVRAVASGVAISEPEYQLLDSGGTPHNPAATVPVDMPRPKGGHAAPPPSVYHESINFDLPAGRVKGPLQLQAVLPTGSGPEYRVTVAAQNSRRSSTAEDLPATCASPGEQGV
jgi:hypothetical protein